MNELFEIILMDESDFNLIPYESIANNKNTKSLHQQFEEFIELDNVLCRTKQSV